MQIEVPEFLGHCSRDPEVIGSDIFGSFTQLVVKSEKRPKLSAKRQTFGDLLFRH